MNRAKWPLTLGLVLALALAFSGAVDRIGFDYTDQGFKRALVAFAMARGLNGVISVAQGTEVAIQPAGVGVNFTPGQILDPINDLVERFSWVMLLAATSLGVQKLLLGMFSVTGFNLVLGAVVLTGVIALWSERFREALGGRWLLRGVLLMLLLRFAVPVAAMLNEALYSGFMQTQYEQSTQAIEQATADISRLNRSTEQSLAGKSQDDSLLGSAKRLYASALESFDIQAYVERYRNAAADVSEQVVNLIVIFIMQTVVVPLLFLWGMLQLAKRTLRLESD